MYKKILLFGVILASIPTVSPAQDQPPKHYPWDRRPNKCFMAGAPSTGMCRAQSDWEEFTPTVEHLSSLITDQEFDLLRRAEQEIGNSSTQFPTGKYLFEAWDSALSRTVEDWGLRGAQIAEQWKLSGDDMGQLAQAYVRYGQAWSARGSGTANTVSPEGWQIFYQKLAEANALLDSASVQVRDGGTWYLLKLRIAYLDPKLSATRLPLIDKAASRWPDCASIYQAPMNQARPIWGGNFELVDAVARFAMQRSQKKLGATFYAVAYLGIVGRDNITLKDTRVDWPLMKQAFRDTDAHHYGHRRLRKTYAEFACQMRDRNEALRLFTIYDQMPKSASEAATDDSDADACRKFATDGTSI